MNVPRTRWHLVSTAELLYLGIERTVGAIFRGGVTRYLLDGSRVTDPTVLASFDAVSEQAASLLSPLPVMLPVEETPEPWGEVRLVAEDIGLAEVPTAWEISEAGFYIPAPKKLIPANVARDISAVATKALSLSGPPKEKECHGLY